MLGFNGRDDIIFIVMHETIILDRDRHLRGVLKNDVAQIVQNDN